MDFSLLQRAIGNIEVLINNPSTQKHFINKSMPNSSSQKLFSLRDVQKCRITWHGN